MTAVPMQTPVPDAPTFTPDELERLESAAAALTGETSELPAVPGVVTYNPDGHVLGLVGDSETMSPEQIAADADAEPDTTAASERTRATSGGRAATVREPDLVGITPAQARRVYSAARLAWSKGKPFNLHHAGGGVLFTREEAEGLVKPSGSALGPIPSLFARSGLYRDFAARVAPIGSAPDARCNVVIYRQRPKPDTTARRRAGLAAL